jgi:hypothetical protein
VITLHDNFTKQQAKDQWAVDISHGSCACDIRNVGISNGGLLHINTGEVAPSDLVTLTNVWNKQGSEKGGMYYVMLWPPGDDKHQIAVPKLVWNNTGTREKVHQGSAECAFRAKCDDLQVIGVHFVAFLQPNGHPWKQVIEMRHGKKMLFQNVTFEQGWPDLGQQQVANKGYVASQQIGVVTFDQCTFTRWNDQKHKKVVSRQPGVGKVVYANCIGPDGKKFSRTE